MDTLRMISKIMISIFLGVLLFISVTYAFFVAQLNGLESGSTVQVETGTMSIAYESDDTIILSNIMPGAEEVKTFTLKGKNDTNKNTVVKDNNMYYKIGIDVLENTFSTGAIEYKLKLDESSTNKESDMVISEENVGHLPNGKGIKYIASGAFSENTSEVNHIYKLTIGLPETGEDQTEEQGKRFSAKIVIEQAGSYIDYGNLAG